MFDSMWGTLILAIVILFGLFLYCYRSGSNYDKFKANGIRTEAKILSMEKIGASGGGSTKLKMELSFNTDSGLVTATAKQYIPPQNMVKIMRNNTIYIYYMPDNPKELLPIPWEME
ncbi:hypothetical protein REX01_001183 [Klebsiella aerogenes]|uniref:DUF3592 domain-containing protein n=1 Tax=Klebsiella aerogenes TaxID=548 RepID=UPI0027F127D1|nr:hypothetical protein [Klebsiella aerogenes]